MASLVVLKFDSPDGAEKGLALAQSLQKQQLLQILDAATVAWPKGKKRPKTRQAPLGALGALDGAFWGMLIGFIFFVPFFGMALGATMGGLGGHFADHGISDNLIKQVRAKVTEGTSGLFLLLGAVDHRQGRRGLQGGPALRAHRQQPLPRPGEEAAGGVRLKGSAASARRSAR